MRSQATTASPGIAENVESEEKRTSFNERISQAFGWCEQVPCRAAAAEEITQEAVGKTCRFGSVYNCLWQTLRGDEASLCGQGSSPRETSVHNTWGSVREATKRTPRYVNFPRLLTLPWQQRGWQCRPAEGLRSRAAASSGVWDSVQARRPPTPSAPAVRSPQPLLFERWLAASVPRLCLARACQEVPYVGRRRRGGGSSSGLAQRFGEGNV